MANVGTWVSEKYGPSHEEVLYVETTPGGSDLPWMVYASGGGWQRISELFFFDSAAGEPLWIDQIHANIGSYPVKCFVINYPRRRTDWSLNNDNDITQQALGKYATTPRFRGEAVRGFQRGVQHIKKNWERFGINPNAGIGFGASAGGQIVAACAYSPSAPFQPGAEPQGGSRRYPAHHSSRLGAIHLRITPTKMTALGERTIHGAALYGMAADEDWTNLDHLSKAAMSAVELGLQHNALVPTFYYSNESLSPTAAQDPPWINSDGVWDSGTTYGVGDTVRVSGANYYCILGHTNQTPPNVTYWEEYSGTPYHHPIQGKVLKEEVFDLTDSEYVFAHPDSGHTYPDDTYDWLKVQWNRLLSGT